MWRPPAPVDDPEVSSVYMGQGVGRVNAIRPAATVMESICEDAESILRGVVAVVE